MLSWAERDNHETEACVRPYGSHQNWPTEYFCHQIKSDNHPYFLLLKHIIPKKSVNMRRNVREVQWYV